MKKKIRRLRLERETVRDLTPEHLEAVAGGGNDPFNSDTRYNSCDFQPRITCINTICNSCIPLICF